MCPAAKDEISDQRRTQRGTPLAVCRYGRQWGGEGLLHIVICDDQGVELQGVLRAAQDFFAGLTDHKAEFHTFENPMDFLDYLEKGGRCDIVLLDICMPGLDGIQLARQLRQRQDRVELVFLTTSPEFAVEAFSLKAAHYLIKPFTQEQLDEALRRAMKPFLPREPKKIVLQGDSGVLRIVEADSILYAENFHHHRAVWTAEEGLKETRRSLSALAEELNQFCPGLFIQPYRGYVVNQNAIRAVTKEGILLQNGVRIPLKAGDFRKWRDAYFEWAFKKEGAEP